MKTSFIVAVAVPGGLVAAGGLEVAYQMHAAAMPSIPILHSLKVRLAAALAVLRVWPVGAVANKRYVQALMTIAATEKSYGTGVALIGDRDADTGPSVTYWQISRGTAVALGLWTSPVAGDDDASAKLYENQNTKLFWGAWAAAKVLDSKLQAHGGDLAAAVRAYNGSGSGADDYLSRAQDIHQANFGSALA